MSFGSVFFVFSIELAFENRAPVNSINREKTFLGDLLVVVTQPILCKVDSHVTIINVCWPHDTFFFVAVVATTNDILPSILAED